MKVTVSNLKTTAVPTATTLLAPPLLPTHPGSHPKSTLQSGKV